MALPISDPSRNESNVHQAKIGIDHVGVDEFLPWCMESAAKL